MRVYDPREDLPPENTAVYCGIAYDSFGGTSTTQCEAIWCPYEGWKTLHGVRVKVLKWCDMPLPKLIEVSSAKKKEEE